FDPDNLRTAGLTLLAIFGALMIWPAAFERLTASVGGAASAASQQLAASHTNLSGFVLGTTLGLVWTPCAGPVLGAILTTVATSPDCTHSAVLLITYTIGAALPMLGVAYGGQALSTQLRRLAPIAGRLQQAFGVVDVA